MRSYAQKCASGRFSFKLSGSTGTLIACPSSFKIPNLSAPPQSSQPRFSHLPASPSPFFSLPHLPSPSFPTCDCLALLNFCFGVFQLLLLLIYLIHQIDLSKYLEVDCRLRADALQHTTSWRHHLTSWWPYFETTQVLATQG